MPRRQAITVTRYDNAVPRPSTGKALSAAERMRRYRARRRAAGLRTTARSTPRVPVWSDHRIAEAKSLALHVIAARRIAAKPRLLARARSTLARWLDRYGDAPPTALLEWRDLLAYLLLAKPEFVDTTPRPRTGMTFGVKL